MNVDNYVDYIIAQAEGTKAHTGSEGAPTAAYGLTEAATKNNPKKPGESDRDYAARIISDKYVAETQKAIGVDAWNKMPEGMKVVAVDVNYNSGLANNKNFVNALKSGDYQQALNNTLDIVGITRPDGSKYTSSGLANRRAAIYNVGAQSIDATPISNVDVSVNNGKTSLSYLDNQGKPIQQLTINKPLAPDSKPGLKTPINYNYPLDTAGQNLNTIAPADVNSRADTRLERQGYIAPAEPSYFESLKNSLLEGWNSLGNYFNAPEESQQSQLARQQAAQQQQQAVANQNKAVQDMNARVAAIFGTAAAGNAGPTASSQPLGNFIQQGMLGPLSGTAYGNVQTLQQAQQAQAGMLAKEQAAEAARKAEEARQAAAIAQAEQAARAQAIISGNRSYTNPITGQVSYTPSMGPVSSSSSSGSIGGGGGSSGGGGMGGGTGGAKETYGGSIAGIGTYSGVV